MTLWRSVASVRPQFSKACLCTAVVSRLRLSSATFPTTIKFPRYASTLPPVKAASSDSILVGEFGRHYQIEQVLQQKENPPSRVCLASAGNEKFILKDVPSSQFDYTLCIYHSLNENQYLRLPEDAIQGRLTFVYRYFKDNVLSLVQQDLPVSLCKRILRDTLRGLQALHERNIVHRDVKANNILVNWDRGDHGMAIKHVKLADIEDATRVDPQSDIVGVQVGNLMWRSPESHTQARVNTPSDMFSFGIVCIYVMTKQLIFAVKKGSLKRVKSR